MSQPVWQTPAGSLGTVPEGVFYTHVLSAVDPAAGNVYYKVIAGDVPQGIEITPNGLIQGIPSANVTVGSEQIQTGRDVTSKFAVRAYTTVIVAGRPVPSRIADRTFELTVASQNYPQWITPAGRLSANVNVFDGNFYSNQLQYLDDNTSSEPDISLSSGQLPPGLTLSGTGLLSGVIIPNPGNNPLAGYSRDGQGYSKYAFDFSQRNISYNYEFTLQVTDGKTSALRTFSIFVVATSQFSADNTFITADSAPPTNPPGPGPGWSADVSSVPAPIVLNAQGSIGTAQNDNFYAYQFFATIVNGDNLNFAIDNPPPGLTLDPVTGWLYGYIPNLGLTELTYEFTVYAYSTVTAGLISAAYDYSITFVGPISTAITWLTPGNLGTIANGSTSQLYVEAVSTAGLTLQYQIAPGSDSALPPGLMLTPDGLIVGRASFDTFALDMGTTTFDNDTTTFDLTYTFIVNAYSINGYVNVFKEFTIHVDRVYNEPYNNLYIQCMPPREDRIAISSLLQNRTVFPEAMLYRASDPNFGLAQKVVYNHAFGLTAATQEKYVQSLDLNHYWKNLVLGEIKTAQALDDAGNVIYEVVYSEIIDNLVNNDGVSVGKEVTIAYPINPTTVDEIDVVFPNALVDMRTQVIDVVGQVSNMLPGWMLSKQPNGNVLGFTPAWVIAYTIPGASGQIAYNITSTYGNNLNLIDFKADRYELDRALTYTWDPETVSFTIDNIVANGTTSTVSFTGPATPFAVGDSIVVAGVTPTFFNDTFYVTGCTNSTVTFNSDRVGTYISGGTVSSTPNWVPQTVTPTYRVTITSTTNSGYNVGDQILIDGADVGGVTGVNDVLITVVSVIGNGKIFTATCSGTPVIVNMDTIYRDVAGTNVTGTGVDATWDVVISITNTDSQAFDRYLLYPKYDIINNLPVVV